MRLVVFFLPSVFILMKFSCGRFQLVFELFELKMETVLFFWDFLLPSISPLFFLFLFLLVLQFPFCFSKLLSFSSVYILQYLQPLLFFHLWTSYFHIYKLAKDMIVLKLKSFRSDNKWFPALFCGDSNIIIIRVPQLIELVETRIISENCWRTLAGLYKISGEHQSPMKLSLIHLFSLYIIPFSFSVHFFCFCLCTISTRPSVTMKGRRTWWVDKTPAKTSKLLS